MITKNNLIHTIEQAFKELENEEIAAHSQRFFKTGKGEYGEGDIFLGVRVPQIRQLVKEYKQVSLDDIRYFLHSKYHEHRLFAVLMLVFQYQKSKDSAFQQEIVEFYLCEGAYVNNWDLVDSSAHKILGHHLLDKDRHMLYDLAQSTTLWDRRIAIISTFAFIAKDDCTDALMLSERLLHDSEDLMHKAVGWVLREVGKVNKSYLTDFLDRHTASMPRTMLRYAIEKLSPKERRYYLAL